MSIPMTEAEVRSSLKGLSRQLDKYATLLVRKGAAIEPGSELVLSAPVERADFARRVVRAAYKAGAAQVTTIWSDDEITRLTYENVDIERLRHTPSWKREQLDSLAEAGASFLFLEGTDPSILKGIDPAKPAAVSHARNTECKSFRDGMDFGRNVWSIAGVPVAKWACHVFPGVSEGEALYRLWVAILEVSRAAGDDPQSEWERHNATFEKNKRLLNSYAFDSLHYTSSNGTDFTLGMNHGHVWEGGASRTVDGKVFFPNIPTEEVFTSPDFRRADGVVHAALPLVHAGQVVSDFWFRFEHGRVVDYGAAEGKEVLRHILDTDDGARHLGECALIAKNTPIRESGLIFYDTLYDENASCHLALGMGFPECIDGGFNMNKDQLLEHGVNQSSTHVDFMIGSDDLCVTGKTASGEEVPVFVDGLWAWE